MDACFETDTFSGGGAVPVDSRGVWCQFFSQQIHTDLLRRITVTSKKNAIFELEFFFAILCCLFVWKGLRMAFNLLPTLILMAFVMPLLLSNRKQEW